MVENRVDPRHLMLGGAALILLASLPGWAPAGPWGQPSFTRGVVGLVGGGCVYVGWFEWKFGVRGLIPTLRLWRDPRTSKKALACLGVALFFASNVLGTQPWAPAPAALLVNLTGLLLLLMALYAHLVVGGPWSSEEE